MKDTTSPSIADPMRCVGCQVELPPQPGIAYPRCTGCAARPVIVPGDALMVRRGAAGPHSAFYAAVLHQIWGRRGRLYQLDLTNLPRGGCMLRAMVAFHADPPPGRSLYPRRPGQRPRWDLDDVRLPLDDRERWLCSELGAEIA